MNSNKADISMQVIVLAIIALLILVILAFIFTGKLGGVNNDMNRCQANAKCEPSCDGNSVRVSTGCVADDGKYYKDRVCCKELFTDTN